MFVCFAQIVAGEYINPVLSPLSTNKTYHSENRDYALSQFCRERYGGKKRSWGNLQLLRLLTWSLLHNIRRRKNDLPDGSGGERFHVVPKIQIHSQMGKIQRLVELAKSLEAIICRNSPHFMLMRVLWNSDPPSLFSTLLHPLPSAAAAAALHWLLHRMPPPLSHISLRNLIQFSFFLFATAKKGFKASRMSGGKKKRKRKGAGGSSSSFPWGNSCVRLSKKSLRKETFELEGMHFCYFSQKSLFANRLCLRKGGAFFSLIGFFWIPWKTEQKLIFQARFCLFSVDASETNPTKISPPPTSLFVERRL